MLRILAVFLIFYFLFKAGGFILRMFLGGLGAKSAYQQAGQNSQQQKRRTADGVSIDFVPEEKSARTAKNFKGGEYIDYEEIK